MRTRIVRTWTSIRTAWLTRALIQIAFINSFALKQTFLIWACQETFFKESSDLFKTVNEVQVLFRHTTNACCIHTITITTIWAVLHAWASFHTNNEVETAIMFTSIVITLINAGDVASFAALIAFSPVLQIIAQFSSPSQWK